MKIVSLFDGISCGQLALKKAGVEIEKYHAAEINSEAIAVTQKNHPDTIQLGDVNHIDFSKLDNTDLLIGGSPCQNLSRVIINRIEHNQGLQGEKSSLFYKFLLAFKLLKPKYFLLENVIPNNSDDIEIISESLGLRPHKINSNSFSAQDRIRLYWTNISFGSIPDQSDLTISDIALPAAEVLEKYWYKNDFEFHGEHSKIQTTLNVNTHEMLRRVYNLNNKCGTLTCVSGGYQQKKVFQDGRCRKLTPLEYERLQTLPDNYTAGFSDTSRYSMIGNGWTADLLTHIFKGIRKETNQFLRREHQPPLFQKSLNIGAKTL
jgi:DNA (cytosine-5)-methyltransferase 3A